MTRRWNPCIAAAGLALAPSPAARATAPGSRACDSGSQMVSIGVHNPLV